jgi:hypothetical protein
MTAAFLLLAALAHHSHPTFYDACTILTIEERVDTVQWKNPHVLIDLTANDGKAYRAEWTSAGILEQKAVKPPAPGDRVVIRANPMRDDAAIRARFPDFKPGPREKPVVDLIAIRRPSDGWSWSYPDAPATTDCGRK